MQIITFEHVQFQILAQTSLKTVLKISTQISTGLAEIAANSRPLDLE